MARFAVRLALFGVLVWVALIAVLLASRHSLIYPFRAWPIATQTSGLVGAEVHELIASDGVPLSVWRVEPRLGKPDILFFTGNAGSLPSSGPRLNELALQGYGIIAMNYRGSGGAPGVPSQAAITTDALSVYDAYASTPPIIYGTSLGAAVATQVAAKRKAAALVLETPFARLCETAQHQYPIVPACLVMWDERWDSLSAIDAHVGPLLILHGDADRIVPIAHGRRLFAAANEPK